MDPSEKHGDSINSEILPLIAKGGPIPERKPRRGVANRIFLAVLFWTVYYLLFYQFIPLLVELLSHHDSPDVIGTVRWGPCRDPGSLPDTECGYIIVPKDYFNSTAGTAKIALGKLKAKHGRLGTIFFNPGGPGGRAKPLIIRSGDHIQSETSSRYDIIGFDPRGVGETLPAVRCFDDSFTHSDFMQNTVLERSYDFASNQSHAEIRQLLIAQEREADALIRTQFARCTDKLGDELKYMGTSTVVRDIDFMSKHIEGEDALINYFGGSYGSILGQYLVNMLPHRVGKVAIDAIADATLWSTEPPHRWYGQWLSQSEKAFEIFLEECFKAGFKACPLARSTDTSPSDISTRLTAFHDSLYYNPVSVPDAQYPGILTAGRSRLYLTVALELPSLLNAIYWWNHLIYTDLERSAITCNDVKPFPPPSVDELVDSYLDVYYNVSRFVFGVVTSEPDSGCQYWPVSPPERFDGPWNHTLQTPMLILSSAVDPVTPAGKRIDEIMGPSSRLLIHDNPGHGANSIPSPCVWNFTRAYFEEGVLPPEGTVCPLEYPLFPGADKAQTLSMEDKEMLEDWKKFRINLERARRGLEI